MLTRLTSTDSVSRELAEIRDTNASVRGHRRARARLGEIMVTAGTTMAETFWPGYLDERIVQASSSIASSIAASQPPGPSAWSVQELTASLSRVGRADGFPFVPHGSLEDALHATGGSWAWGQTTLVRLADMTMDLLKRAVVLAPVNDPQTQGVLVKARADLRVTLDAIAAYSRDLDRFWTDGARRGQPPQRRLSRDPDDASGTISTGSATNIEDLDPWLAQLVRSWDGAFGGDDGTARRGEQYKGAMTLAAGVLGARTAVDAIVQAPNRNADPTGTGVEQLTALDRWLLPADADAAEVLRRMLLLDVVLLSTSGALEDPEQEVELVQISCANRASITGMQLNHFGAFYRMPWRVNDWIEGRMDGSRQLMRLLLDPDRLRQLGYTKQTLLDALHEVAVPAGHPDHDWLDQRWQNNVDEYGREIESALKAEAQTTALDVVSEAAAMPLRLGALRDDLDALADAIRTEGSDTMPGSAQWLTEYETFRAAAPPPAPGQSASAALRADALWTLRKNMWRIGTQKINNDLGSDTFARTVSHAAVVTTGAFTARTQLKHVKVVQFVLSAMRGYVALLYGMVAYITRGSAIGTRLVELAVAAGGVLLAVTIFVPSVPIGLTLAGVLLLLAGASASALLTKGARGMGVRVLIAVLLVGGALGYLIWRDIDDHGFHGQVVSVTIKVCIALGIVLVGWFIANAGFGRTTRRR